MRLLHTIDDSAKLEVEEFDAGHIPKYGILSHTWEEEEISYLDMQGLNAAGKKGYEKIRKGSFIAKSNGLDYFWVDTCCIDKTSSAELSEAINSMYRWYQEAEVCYAYLADVAGTTAPGSGQQITNSKWFKRGWTLQELIAPETVVFFDRDWNELGTKDSLRNEISQRTTIPTEILSGEIELGDMSVAQRMSWAADRETKRVEDRAYSLMGIFGINMPLLYGEGEMAFIRLQEEVIKVLDDYTIFAWESEHSSYGGLLATTPDAFRSSADITPEKGSGVTNRSPWMVTNQGIHVEVPFVAIGPRGLGLGLLPCEKAGNEDLFMGVFLRDVSLTMTRFERVAYGRLVFLNPERLRPPQYPIRQICVQQRRFALTSRPKRTVARERLDKEASELDLICAKLQSLRLTSCDVGKLEGQTGPSSLKLANSGYIDDSGARTIFPSSMEKDKYCVWYYLSNPNINVNTGDRDGKTPLTHAARRGKEDLVWMLLSRSDINVHPRDTDGLTPLFYAANHGYVPVIDMILSKGFSGDDLIDRNGQTVLYYASRFGHEAAVKLLLKRCIIDINGKDKSGRTSLIWAATEGYAPVARSLLSHGADVNTFDSSHSTALHMAVINRHASIVHLLLARGADVDLKDTSGKTALHWAVKTEQESIANQLIAHGADVNISDHSNLTSLHIAVMNKALPLVRLLLAQGAAVECKSPTGRTALYWAVMNRQESAVRLLIAHGADIESKDASHGTVLHYAASIGYVEMVEVLLANGADLASRDSDQETALHKAAISGHKQVVRTLLVHGACVEWSDSSGKTALHWAASRGHALVVKLLLANGANIESRDVRGKKALHYAKERGHLNVVDLLLPKRASNRNTIKSLLHSLDPSKRAEQ